jgi:hypothetical protein
LVGYSDNDVLRGFAYQHFDGWQLGIFRLALFDDSLDGVSQKLANDVFKVTQNVWKRRIDVAVNFDLWDVDMRAIGALDQLLHCLTAIFDYVFRVAPQEYLADCLLVMRMDLGLGEMPWRIKSLGKR